MRTSIILLLVTVLCVTTTHAQSIPANVTSVFAQTYPNAKSVKWEDDDGKYEATFKSGGDKISVLYNTNGTVAETESSIAVNDLPAKALAYARAKGKVQEAAKIVSASGVVTYEAEVKGTDLLFDDQGNYIESSTDEEDAD